MEDTKQALKRFLTIVIGISIVLEGCCVLDFHFWTGGTLSTLFIMLLMWTPGVTAIFICKGFAKGYVRAALGLRRCKVRYVLLGIAIPAVYLFFSYGIYWIIEPSSFTGYDTLVQALTHSAPGEIPTVLFLLIFTVVGIPISAMSAAGEEIGWRGFMYPAMEECWGRRKALIASGLLWGCWHLPIIIGGVYQAKTQIVYGMVSFVIEIGAFAMILAWLRMRSGSVWPAILAHAAHNFFDQSLLQPVTQSAKAPYFAGEQGWITILMVVAIAVVVLLLWKRSDAKQA